MKMTPRRERDVRANVMAGPRGWHLGLDKLGHRLVWSEMFEHGDPAPGAPELPPGCVVVHVWTTAELHDVEELIHTHRAAGVIVIPVVFKPTAATRRKNRRAWRRWRRRARWAPVLRVLRLVKPTYWGVPIERAMRETDSKKSVD